MEELRRDSKVARYLDLQKEEVDLKADLQKELSFSLEDVLEERDERELDFFGSLFEIPLTGNDATSKREQLIREISANSSHWVERLPYHDIVTLASMSFSGNDGAWKEYSNEVVPFLETFGFLRRYVICDRMCGVLPRELKGTFSGAMKYYLERPRAIKDIEDIRLAILNTYGLVPLDDMDDLLSRYLSLGDISQKDVDESYNYILMRTYCSGLGKDMFYHSPLLYLCTEKMEPLLKARLGQKDIPYKTFSLNELLSNKDISFQDIDQNEERWMNKGYGAEELKTLRKARSKNSVRSYTPQTEPRRLILVKDDGRIDDILLFSALERLSPWSHSSVHEKIAAILNSINPPVDRAQCLNYYSSVRGINYHLKYEADNLPYIIHRAAVDSNLTEIIRQFNTNIPSSSVSVRKRTANFGAFLQKTLDEAPIMRAPSFTYKALANLTLAKLPYYHKMVLTTLEEEKDTILELLPDTGESLLNHYKETFELHDEFFRNLATVNKDDAVNILRTLRNNLNLAFKDLRKAISKTEDKYYRTQFEKVFQIYWKELFLL